MAKFFFVSNEKLFRRISGSLRVFVPIQERNQVWPASHNDLSHLDARKTLHFFAERVRWLLIKQDDERYVKTCDVCQRMKSDTKYVVSLARPIIGYLVVFSIDFLGCFPTPY